ncbi:uncharacterized protein CC84DRAFT_860009 [Paraphaeosphaeria sporulosa]|uniref:Uncharacterized protein n=1 Tax=Paraphaeosphaeria sporulosa TaxID=1460663 RepID=A0A177C9Z3_9PLEO|nr:uncharacterized protein CC84DRAFT_860009 [Paraphaeosphaeria sporulosa]OAG03577.1 hypothetical protein CC84DRAFT_860009 [Paraphaeosphaeria sporulosa]
MLGQPTYLLCFGLCYVSTRRLLTYVPSLPRWLRLTCLSAMGLRETRVHGRPGLCWAGILLWRLFSLTSRWLPLASLFFRDLAMLFLFFFSVSCRRRGISAVALLSGADGFVVLRMGRDSYTCAALLGRFGARDLGRRVLVVDLCQLRWFSLRESACT